MTPQSLTVLSSREVPEVAVAAAEAPSDTSPARQKPLRKALMGTLFALITLLYVMSAAVVTLVLGGVLLHLLTPHRTFDIFFALHKQFVVGTLLGLAIFWLLPPHPWVNESEERGVREPADVAGETESGGVSNVTALSEYRGRGPSHRPSGHGEVVG